MINTNTKLTLYNQNVTVVLHYIKIEMYEKMILTIQNFMYIK